MRTHYDNLNVSENASDEAILAAYKALILHCLSDRNGGDENRRTMEAIDESYLILSDSAKRREYDSLLAAVRGSSPSQDKQIAPSPKKRKRRSMWRVVSPTLLILLCVLVVKGLDMLPSTMSFSGETPIRTYSPSGTAPSSVDSSDEVDSNDEVDSSEADYSSDVDKLIAMAKSLDKPKWVRPNLTPVNTIWPTTAAYVDGYSIQAQGGLSSVTIDNSQNTSDVFLKLVWLSNSEAIPARICFIPASSSFTFSTVMAGRYDVRYRDLNTGALSKTEEFTLEETKTYNGTNYSNLSLTLYKVAHGNMETETIDESEF